MKTFRPLLIAAALALPAAAAPAGPIAVTVTGGDAALNALGPNLVAVAEGRLGNASLNPAEHELSLGRDTGGDFVTGQVAWQSGVPRDFQLTYDADARRLGFSLAGGPMLDYEALAADASVGRLFVRARAGIKAGTQASITSLTGLTLTDAAGATSLGDFTISADGASGARTAVWSVDGLGGGDFKLAGTAQFDWFGQMPSRSHSAFQFKLAQASVVPSPTAAGGAILAAAAVLLARRRR